MGYMISKAVHHASKVIVALGRRMPKKVVKRAGILVREIEMRRWMDGQGLTLDHVVQRREELFELVGAEIGNRPVLYLEFGVAEGDATRTWSSLLKHPDSVLHGFDCFEGLPETWEDNRPKGMFSTGGNIPLIADQRVKFFKGLFQDSLASYAPPKMDSTVFNLDADLYSSTATVLKRLGHLIRPGTYLYFDEFSSLGHEERAFREFVDETGLKFSLRGGTRNLIHVLFQCKQA
jgi:hypothetical protein